jgi:L-asparaginase II
MIEKTNPVLVEIYRNKVLESFHRGVVCVVDKDGEILYSEGDVNQVCYPRSAMKLLQALPLIELGGIEKFGFTLEEIAIMCGSHNAEPEHLRVVNSILSKIGLTKDALFCGPQYPSSKKDANALIKNDEKPQHIHNNCSGKHAGMLALCKLIDAPIDNYINPQHPAQKLIMDACAEMFEYEKEKMIVALDGCSAPIFSIPVYHQALSYKNIVHPIKFSEKRQHACKLIVDAISQYPFMIAGTKRYCTDMMQVCAPRIIGKTGAEGIFCLGLTEEKIGVCIKIDDGKMAPQYNVAQVFIKHTGIFTHAELAPLHHYQESEIINFNKFITGEIRVREGLFSKLKLE